MQNEIKNAIRSNHAKELFSGLPPFDFQNPDGNLPTDTALIVRTIADELQTDSDLRSKVILGLRELSEDPEFCWLVAYYLIDLLNLESNWKSALLTPDLIQYFQAGLIKNMNSLQHNRKWVGEIWENGIWGDILRLNKIIERLYGVRLLAAESGNDQSKS